jgi:hypothetical protein
MTVVYPVTKEFEKDLEKVKIDVSNREISIYKVAEAAKEIVNEYEHGTADVEDCGGVNIKQYKDVIHDFILFLFHYEEE